MDLSFFVNFVSFLKSVLFSLSFNFSLSVVYFLCVFMLAIELHYIWHAFTPLTIFSIEFVPVVCFCRCACMCACTIELDKFCWELIGSGEILTCGYVCLTHTLTHNVMKGWQEEREWC